MQEPRSVQDDIREFKGQVYALGRVLRDEIVWALERIHDWVFGRRA